MTEAHPPSEIAHLVERQGVAKAETGTLSLLVLAVLAGAFISLGALFFTVVVTGSNLGFGITRLIGGVCFWLGLILVVVGGAELFTGNNLLAMAWASRLIGTGDVLRNWILVYLGNVVGCLGTVAFVIGGTSLVLAADRSVRWRFRSQMLRPALACSKALPAGCCAMRSFAWRLVGAA